MAFAQLLFLLMSVTLSLGQRGSYAGTKPIGYPEVQKPDDLGNRFGDGDSTTAKLPFEAMGDRDLVDRLSQLPQDNQAFWLLNSQALQANREKPQVYPHRPGSFVDFASNPSSSNSQNLNTAIAGNKASENPISGTGENPGPQFGNQAPKNQNLGNTGNGNNVYPNNLSGNLGLSVNNRNQQTASDSTEQNSKPHLDTQHLENEPHEQDHNKDFPTKKH